MRRRVYRRVRGQPSVAVAFASAGKRCVRVVRASPTAGGALHAGGVRHRRALVRNGLGLDGRAAHARVHDAPVALVREQRKQTRARGAFESPLDLLFDLAGGGEEVAAAAAGADPGVLQLQLQLPGRGRSGSV